MRLIRCFIIKLEEKLLTLYIDEKTLINKEHIGDKTYEVEEFDKCISMTIF